MRYIGSKIKIVDLIEKEISKLNLKQGYTFTDLFSGTATVSKKLSKSAKIISNDHLYFAKCLATMKLNNSTHLTDVVNILNNLNGEVGFITKNYSNYKDSKRQYLTVENAMKVDAINKYLDNSNLGLLDKEIIKGLLIEAVSLVSNVAGVYGAYLKEWDKRAFKPLILDITLLNKDIKYKSEVFNEDALEIVKLNHTDVLYLDPPYTKTSYSSQYHLLETIALNDEPTITGITGTRANKVSSNFTKKLSAEIELAKILFNTTAKHIFLSYSSDGIMSVEYISQLFKRFGIKDSFKKIDISYKRYANSKSESEDIKEYLFYIEKADKIFYESPLHYQGNKHKMIEEIYKITPKHNNSQFLDLFGGGLNVGINIDSKKIIYGEINPFVTGLLKWINAPNLLENLQNIEKIIKKHKLSKSGKESYNKLRDLYNKESEFNPVILYTLIIYSFNQMIRFNSNMQYNNPIGLGQWNDTLMEKFITFNLSANNKDIIYINDSFFNINFNNFIPKDTIIYLDPPYLITLGSYNDGKRGFEGWNSNHEKQLYEKILSLDKQGFKIILSNVINHNGKTNEILKETLKNNKQLNIKKLNLKREELLVTNYDISTNN